MHRNVALIKDGSVVNVVVYEDDPTQLPGYVQACLVAGTARDFLDAAAEEHDAVVELHDGEMCEPGMVVKPEVAELQPARVGEKLGVVRITRTMVQQPVEESVGVIRNPDGTRVDGKEDPAPVMVEGKSTIAASRFERAARE